LTEGAKKGQRARVHYTGKLSDGSVFDSSAGRDPLEFIVGGRQVIDGFDDAVLGMKPGDRKTVHIPAEKAYGPVNQELLIRKKKSEFPPAIKPEIGMRLQLRHPSGSMLGVSVVEIRDFDDLITLDGNHPLAGKDLVFEIELVEIKG
jgi:peptidylprolyl isomerase